jgi:hypothetical protein
MYRTIGRKIYLLYHTTKNDPCIWEEWKTISIFCRPHIYWRILIYFRIWHPVWIFFITDCDDENKENKVILKLSLRLCMLPTFFRGETTKSMEESEESGEQCTVVFALIVTKLSRRVADSPSRGVVFRLRKSPRIRSQNRNGSKGSVRDLWGNNFCKNPRKSATLPCPFKCI